ncbi:MAG: hypothetical protein KDA91_13405 [Planctomycetaceae bacterium]|nr:hypothetical protein [Planctomycetaceae bacterium]
MAKFDSRIDALVVETRTSWDPSVGDLPPQDRQWVAHTIHQNPSIARNIEYIRTHSGFIRHITVTVEDIQQLYLAKS